ncbi:glycosyltransferase family 4 protein [Candidatus Saccharibacteria bacterium]|nr:glycosyltransferase family 4 protein [Candidatus Saccharibacteria bacterium]
MNKIVIDARELNATGTGTYLKHLLDQLQKLDTTNSYKILLKPQDIDSWKPTNRRFSKIVCPYKEFTFGEQLGLFKLLRSLQSDLVHFAMVQQPLLYRGKVVTTMHDLTTARFRNPSKNWLIFTIKQFVYKLVNRIVAHKSAALIADSEYIKEDVAKFARINSRKITVIPLAADKLTVEPEPVEDLLNRQFIMYVGRPQPHKNLDRLVQAFGSLRQVNPGLRLVLVGKRDTLYKQLAKRTTERGITGVIFTGFVSDSRLRWLYEHTAAYVFPSLSEGFGLPGLEAMVHGAPLISSNATCLPEVYQDAAEYFDPTDTEQIATAIQKVLDSEEVRKKLIKRGVIVAQKYSWQRLAEQTLAVYTTVLEEN